MARIETFNTPATLYRYRGLRNKTVFQREIDAIKGSELHFSILGKLNDPMEGLSRRRVFLKPPTTYTQNIKTMLRKTETTGICSLSDTYNNEVMWAHYAGNYSGICVGYKTRALLGGLDADCALIRIQYVDRSPLISKLEVKKTKLSARKILSFKNGRWQYEREWRLLSDQTGLIPIRMPNCITSIRMGSRIAKNHHAAIETLVSKMKDVTLYMMNVRSYEHRWDKV